MDMLEKFIVEQELKDVLDDVKSDIGSKEESTTDDSEDKGKSLKDVLGDVKKDVGMEDDKEAEEEPTEEPVEGEEGGEGEEEVVEEEPEEEDLTIMPYSDKIQMIISMIKEFGFSNIDYQIDQGKNNIIIKGKLESSDKSALTGLSKEMDININIEETSIEDKTLTTLKFSNPITLDKFLQIQKGEEEASTPVEDTETEEEEEA